jgi:hypothetical protein
MPSSKHQKVSSRVLVQPINQSNLSINVGYICSNKIYKSYHASRSPTPFCLSAGSPIIVCKRLAFNPLTVSSPGL